MSISTHWYYLLVNLGCLLVPFIFSFHPKLKFYQQWKAFAIGVLIMMAIFIPWDIFFTANGIWGFNDKYTCGVFIQGLPIEEWLFFICIPYASVFTYHCFSILLKETPAQSFLNYLAWIIAVVNIVIAIVYYDRWYTFIAHLLCSLLLFYHLFICKSKFLPMFMFMYMIILIPFILSNGVLTGVDFWTYAFINFDVENIREKIVWYNNEHNLRLRIFSVPIDDIAYGMSMLLLTTTVFERFKTATKPL